MKKLKSLSWWKKKADAVYSQYRRLSEADSNEMVVCITCKKILHWKESQNSHYISRNHLSTRFLDENTHAACVGCNVFGGGRLDEYAIYLRGRYGKGILEKLNRIKHTSVKYTIPDYQEMIINWKAKIKKLLSQIN